MKMVRWARYKGPMDEAERNRILHSQLFMEGDTILVWVNEGDILTAGKSMDPIPIVDWRGLAAKLAPLYCASPVTVAELCDEKLDRSGALLGLVREEAKALR